MDEGRINMSLITTVAQESYIRAKFTIEHCGVTEQSRFVESMVKLFLDHDFDVEGIIKDYDEEQLKKINDTITEIDEVSDSDERTKEFERNQL